MGKGDSQEKNPILFKIFLKGKIGREWKSCIATNQMFDVPEEQRKVLGVWKQSEQRINLVSEKWPNTIRKPNNGRERKNEETTFQNKHNSDSKEMVIQELAMLQGSSRSQWNFWQSNIFEKWKVFHYLGHSEVKYIIRALLDRLCKIKQALSISNFSGFTGMLNSLRMFT